MTTINPLDWLKLPQRILWGLLIVFALVLWAPPWFIDGLGLQDLLKTYRIYVGAIFLLLLAATIPNLAIWLFGGVIQSISDRRDHKAHIKQLEQLTPHEKRTLAEFFALDTRSMTLDLRHPVNAALINSKILTPSSVMPRPGTRFPVTVQAWAWKAIKANPDLLALGDDGVPPPSG